MNSLSKIRKAYNVPAREGMRVMAYGKPGTIVGCHPTSEYILIRLDGDITSAAYHPVDCIKYER